MLLSIGLIYPTRLIQIKVAGCRPAEHGVAEDGPRSMILIVDADAATRDSLHLLLECEGFAVREYDTVRRFLDEARPARGDCLVFDEQGTGMGAVEFGEALRRRGTTTAAILVTGHASPAQRESARAAGYAAVVEKPYTANEILDAVRLATDR